MERQVLLKIPAAKEDTALKGIAILGSTGSIGRQTLEVIEAWPDRYQVKVLGAHSNVRLLTEQARKYRPELIIIGNPDLRSAVERELPQIPVLTGDKGLEEAARLPSVTHVVVAVTGLHGLRPALEALTRGKVVALANKETLVAAGQLVMETAASAPGKIIPVDSEHSAVFQCLSREQQPPQEIWLTASGGPFWSLPAEELSQVTPSMALNHPNWRMGPKVTIDSATLMNKGLEVIEARWLFGLSLERVKVAIHRQSIVHALVSYCDGSVFAYLAPPDMRLPIQYALSWPQRHMGLVNRPEIWEWANLTFEPPDDKRFPCLRLAYQAGELGGTHPAVLSAADEIAVEAFLEGRLGFMDIPLVVEEALSTHQGISEPSLEDILAADQGTRQWCREYINQRFARG